MLTFFEYLRKRAFESVVAGTQDAVAYLDNQKHFDATEPVPKNEAPTLIEPSSSDSSPSASGQNGPLGPEGGNAEALPAPRRRGRPRKNAEQK